MNDVPRPSPDALLKAARREARGHLKIFLGAAPGVGKTYEMLQQGAAMLGEGHDVIIGVVETHGRAETEALTAPFEILPRNVIAHGAHRLAEFDIDAMLKRRPEVALIDELAHTNVPGSRHPKRWQDVEELRDAGIDVLTTLNVQHLESLNDVVAGFTRVRVRETVPDAILDEAEIEVIDLPPDELIARLRDGKVYVPEEASRALGHFFSKANLSALRELALRRAAQAVDRQMLDHVSVAGEPGLWAAGERVVVALGGSKVDERLVRTAKRLADAFHAPWSAVTVETSPAARGPGPVQERLSAALNLASILGATLVTVPAASVPEGLVAQVRETRATALVMGQSGQAWWRRAMRGTLADRLAHALPDVALHILPQAGARSIRLPESEPLSWRMIGIALLAVGLTTLFNLAVVGKLGVNAIDLLYLLPVIATGALAGLKPALLASALAAVVYNFLFLPPTYSFTIDDPRNVITFLVLAGVGVIASQLTGRLRREAATGARMASENAGIAAFGQRLASISDATETARAICEDIGALLSVSTVVLQSDVPLPRLVWSHPAEASLGPVDYAAADWTLANGESAGRDTATLNAVDWQFHPLATSLGVLAVLGISSPQGGSPLPPDKRVMFATLLGQAALAHERLRLEEEARRAAVLEQRDKLRTTLISSLGHDLKTPLTAVVAAAEALAHDRGNAPLAATLIAQATRLRRLFDDLVEMTRLESGTLAVQREAVDLTDAVAAAVQDLRAEVSGHSIELAVPPSLPLVEADPRMLHHILVNLIDNAAKYAPPGTTIRAEGVRSGTGLSLSIADEGPGIPADEAAELFEQFRRAQGDDRRGGTGLGLAIVKGFAEAMGLKVSATNRTDRAGSRFTLSWPEALLRKPSAPEAGVP